MAGYEEYARRAAAIFCSGCASGADLQDEGFIRWLTTASSRSYTVSYIRNAAKMCGIGL